MKIYKKEEKVLSQVIEGRLSIEEAARKLKVTPAAIYIKGFRFLQARFAQTCTKTTTI